MKVCFREEEVKLGVEVKSSGEKRDREMTAQRRVDGKVRGYRRVGTVTKDEVWYMY